MSIEGQGHSFPYIFQVLYVLCFTRPIYQVSVYRTIGPLVLESRVDIEKDNENHFPSIGIYGLRGSVRSN